KKRLAKPIATKAKPVASWTDLEKRPRASVSLLEMQIDAGWHQDGRLVISAFDVLGSNAGLAAASQHDDQNLLEIGDVCAGDVVIHEDDGIAVVAGLKHPQTPVRESNSGDSIELEYADGARRLIPVEEADRIWRYGADRQAVTLDGLDGMSWRK